MTHQSAHHPAIAGADAGRQVAQLRQVLALVGEIAGRRPSASGDAALDEAARVSSAYGDALPVVQRRFDALAAEASAWAAAGVEALVAASERGSARHAARRLAEELERTLSDLSAMLRL